MYSAPTIALMTLSWPDLCPGLMRDGKYCTDGTYGLGTDDLGTYIRYLHVL